MKRILFILSICMLFACGNSNSPEKVLEKYNRSFLAGTMSENVDLVANDDGTPLSEKAAKEMMEFAEMTRDYLLKNKETDELSIDEFEVGDIEYNESKTKAKVEYRITINGEKENNGEPSHQFMIKANDGWKVVVMIQGTNWLNR